MTLVDIQKVKSNRTKLIGFISDDDCDCLSSWHYSVIAEEQQRKLLEVDSFKCWPFEKLVDLKNRNCISSVFYYYPDKYVSLVLLLG